MEAESTVCRAIPTMSRPRALTHLALAAMASFVLLGAGCIARSSDPSAEEGVETLGIDREALVGYDCSLSQDTGYVSGSPTPITLVTVDGEPVEIDTANAFLTMAQAASNDGVEIHISSGFRTMAQQQYYYNCYINCNCNSCNEAATPGYSNHQSGHALDLNTYQGAVYNWLNAHGSTYGFKRTVASEKWHWEWWGGGVTPALYCSTSCDRSGGGFTFSCDGTNVNQFCTKVDEPADPDSWSDNYFCSDTDWGMQWSNAGPIDGMVCTNVAESAENHASEWSDNFLCVPEQSPFELAWSSAGPVAGMACAQWNEPSDTHSWGDNFICSKAVSTFRNAPFTFSGAGAVPGHCVNVDEPSDPNTWSDNFFCSDDDLGMKWSFSGPLDGMVCTNVTEAADDHAADWNDNYLCLPPSSPYVFSWSSAGPIEGKSCVRWYEAADLLGTWNDNWLCFESKPPVSTSATGGGASGGSSTSLGDSNSDGTGGGSSSDRSSGCSAAAMGQPESLWPIALVVAAGALRRRRVLST